MKKYLEKIMIALLIACTVLQPCQTQAAVVPIPIVEIIKAAVVKVIKAIDLKIQRLQNKTIWLQNAQKTLENTLSKMKLDEIADWNEKQKEQYRKYYDELATVKSMIMYYQRIKEITQKQMRLVNDYNHAWQVLRQDTHFTLDEVKYMEKVYGGILKESTNNIDQISRILKSFSLKMSDAKRLELINSAADGVDNNYNDLTHFNHQNITLSLQRAKTQHEVEVTRKLYGIK